MQLKDMNGVDGGYTNPTSVPGHKSYLSNGYGSIDGHAVNGLSMNGHANGALANGYASRTSEPTTVDKSIEGGVPIAICGMACRLPGGIHTPQNLWDFLMAKGDARSIVPDSRYNVSAFYDPSGKPGTVKTKYGYFLDVDLTKSDGTFSSFARGALERQDPHQLQMCEVARECIVDAGEVNWKGKRIGVYVGSFGEDWVEMNAKEPLQYGIYRIPGYGDFMLSNHVSYEMDLKGPSMTIRTGCSASMVCLHEACRAIQSGDCTSAIVGGVNLILGPGMTQAMSEQGVLSPDGSCKTFSADADGYGRGEAVSAVYLKPLNAALRDGNPIRAVIRQTATNCDGRTPGISTPSTDSQEAMIRKAYEDAGIDDFSQTAFVECHGTGTPTGDPIEANAVARVFGGTRRGVYIGSVKPNLGHSEGASGLTSLLKVVMSLENRVIPPNIKFSSPNRNIPFEECNLKVPLEPTPWPQDGGERVSINSFGIGGTNAHCIIESARSHGIDTAVTAPESGGDNNDEPQLLLYSANSSESLRKTVEAYQGFMENNTERLSRLSYTLANGREHLPYRAFVIANSCGKAIPSATVKAPPQPPKVIMTFTGQGAQWPTMGSDLLKQGNSVFLSTIKALDQIVKDTLKAEWSIEKELLRVGKKSRMDQAEVSQPLCTALQISLVDTLSAVGIKPATVIGHSSGEIAAAYAAGALTAKEAIIVAWLRGAVSKLQQKDGSMGAVGLSWDETKPFLSGTSATIACENSPESVTISGDTCDVETVIAKIKQARPGILARLLKVDKAYHSSHMEEIGERYHSMLIDHQIVDRAPVNCAFYSSVSGRVLKAGETLGPGYWKRNLEKPVLFSTTVCKMLQDPEFKKQNSAVFLEVGPHSVMAGPIRQIMAKESISLPYVCTMTRYQNCVESYLTAIGKLYQLNVAIDIQKLIPKVGNLPFLQDLPRYAWDHEESYWYESRLSKEWRHRKHAYHELIGIRVAESSDLAPTWRNLFHMEHSSWIRDHIIGDDIVFPFAGYMAMAAEAVLQTTSVEDGYALRHVLVGAALVLTEGKPLELITTFRPVRLTDTLGSQWWDFSISSYNGQVWTEHCTGQARALRSGEIGLSHDNNYLPRDLGTAKAYNMMHQAGLNYGPNFQVLQEIRSGTTEQTAAARVAAPSVEGVAARYHIHPVVMDACLQILSVAATKGYTKMLGTVVPTLIDEVKVLRTSSDVGVSANANVNGLGGIVGSARCFSGGETVLLMTGARLTQLPGEETIKDTNSAARYEWAPHIDFSNEASLIDILSTEARKSYMTALAQMTELAVVYAHRRLQSLATELPYMVKYGAWIQSQYKQTSIEAREMDDSSLFDIIKDRLHSLESTPAGGAALAMFKIICGITSIFQGRENSLGVLMREDSLTHVNTLRDRAFDLSRLIRQLAHSRPNVRILELGAGQGARTAEILRDLMPDNGSRVMYSTYVFSDPSSGMVRAAKDKFKGVANMQFLTLDIGRNLEEQDVGSEEDSYDLVIATNVLHTTPDLRQSLTNIRKLLRSGGRLVLQEFSSSCKWLNFIMGVLPWWWNGNRAGRRADEPYLSLAQWESCLGDTGLCISATLKDCEDESLQTNNIMVVKHASIKHEGRGDVTLLCRDPVDTQANYVALELTRAGYTVHARILGEKVREGQDVIAYLDQEGSFFETMNPNGFEAFKELVRTVSISGAKIFWVTHPCHMRCTDPNYATVLGISRTLRSEMSVSIATCEVDDLVSCAGRVVDVFHKFQTALKDNDELDADFEYAITKDDVLVGRFYPYQITKELLPADDGGSVVLETEKPGLLTSLHWAHRPLIPVESNLVEVQTYAAGLNFRDVLGANGIVDIPNEGFGLEAAGIVTAVGPRVKSLGVGDRVFLFSRGSFSTKVVVPEELCERIPDQLSLEDAATMPCVYATAMYSLFNVGRLHKGQSVLIHSACGGVGIAAIQLARMAGADIYVTVGNQEKVQYLMENFGMSQNRIFNSRDMSFCDGIAAETQGRGVDLVLNSLSGELLHATWRCVAEFGTMVEIGKRDLLGAGKLDMSVFLANRSYCCVDLDQICAKKPSICKELLNSVVRCFNDGYILPIKPITVFGASKIREAFRLMQQGQHMGKIVISIRTSAETVDIDTTVAKRKQQIVFDSSASYLLVGGLGGLGRAVSRWMIDHGARHLVYLSRNGGSSEEDQAFVREMQSMGGRITLVQGSVCTVEDVEEAVKAAPNLKGVLQMSMVLRDQAWDNMTFDHWKEATAPKIQGTWNLHQATRATQLDFFVLFSSISGIIGQPGQANYAAANTFLDAFAQWRADQGLPIAAIDIGAVDDIGVISNNENLRRAMKATGAYMMKESELLEAVGAAMTLSQSDSELSHNKTFVLGLASTTPLNSPSNRAIWKNDIRMSAYRNINTTTETSRSGSSSEALKAWLSMAKHDENALRDPETPGFLAREIGKKLFSLVLRPDDDIQTSVSLADLGMDSLVAIEMRSWWKSTFGFNISTLELLGMGNLDILSQHAVDGMLKALHPES